MATNEILRFAETDTGTNLLTQAEYNADSQRPIGNQPGVARSKLINKALRQTSLIAAGIAEYIADNQANNVTDALTPQNIADYLQAAITGALGVTPPQFDNDTSLATTAFVQRALGNASGFKNLGAGTTALTAADAGKFCLLAQAGTIATLPLGSTLSPGVCFQFGNGTSNGAGTVQRSGTDPIYIADSLVSSISVNGGETLSLFWTGALWFAISGSATLYKASTAFGSSLAASGYQKLPSGLIIQWGVGTTSGTASPNLVATLPVAWPTGAFFGGGVGNGWGATCEFVSGNASSISLCYRRSTDQAALNGLPVFWFAIGR